MHYLKIQLLIQLVALSCLTHGNSQSPDKLPFVGNWKTKKISLVVKQNTKQQGSYQGYVKMNGKKVHFSCEKNGESLECIPKHSKNKEPLIISHNKTKDKVTLNSGCFSWDLKRKTPLGDFTIDSISLNMVLIKKGSFMMGSNAGGYTDPIQKKQTISDDFWIGKTEVTQEQYQKIMGDNPSEFKGTTRPVEMVSWKDASEFCKRLNQKEQAANRLPSGYAYQLPMSSEWEYSSKANVTCENITASNKCSWNQMNSDGETHTVATKTPNSWGLYDMQGNVWEWCQDYDIDDFQSVAPTSMSTGTGNQAKRRLMRGGGWSSYEERCQPTSFYGFEPSKKLSYIGFRVALSKIKESK